MKSALWKDNLREIKKSLPRFLSILAIIMLGVSFFIGIKATGPTILETARTAYEEYNLPDGRVNSTLGLNQADLDALGEVEGIKWLPMKSIQTKVEPSSETAHVFTYNGEDSTNFFSMVEGRMPENDQEIVLDDRYLSTLNAQLEEPIEVGDTVSLEQVAGYEESSEAESSESSSQAGETTEPPHFVNTEFEVVGFARTPIFFERETRGLGGATVFGVVHESAIEGDIFTEAYYWAESLAGLEAYSDEYQAEAENVVAALEAAVADRPGVRLEELQADLQTAIEEGETGIAAGYQALQTGTDALNEGQESLESGREDYQSGQEALVQGRESLVAGQEAYESGLDEAASGEAALAEGQATLDESEGTYQEGLQAYNSGLASFSEQIQAGEAQLSQGQSQLDQASQLLNESLPQLQMAQGLLDQGYTQVDALENALETSIREQIGSDVNPDQVIPLLDSQLLQMTGELLGLQEQIDAGNNPVLAEQSAAIEADIQRLETLRLNLNELQTDLNNGEASIETAQQQLITEMIPVLEDLTGESVDSGLAYDDLVNQINGLIDEEINSLSSQLDNLTTQIENLSGSIASLESQQADLQEEIGGLEAEVSRLESEISQINQVTPTDTATLESRLGTERNRLTDAQNNLATSQGERQAVQAEYDSLIANSTSDAPVDSARLALLEQQMSQLDSDIATYQTQVETSQAAIADLENQLANAVTAEDLANQVADLQARQADIQASIDNQQIKLTGVNDQLNLLYEIESQEPAEIQNQLDNLQTQIDTLQQQRDQLNGAVEQINAARTSLDEQEAQLEAGWDQYNQGLAALEAGQQALETGRNTLESGRNQGQTALNEGLAQLESGRAALDEGFQLLAESETALAEGRQALEEADAQIASGWRDLEAGERQALAGLLALNRGEQVLASSQVRFDQEARSALMDLRQAETDLDTARTAMGNLAEPQYIIGDRTGFASYQGVKNNADQLNVIANIFPVFFFLIAILVTFTTIKRMASEQRTYMGTMKQLGYTNGAILKKFVSYALLASGLGIVLGLALGYTLFPPVILGAYNSMYYFDNVVVAHSWMWNMIVSVIALATALTPAILQPYVMLKTEPANLLRPEPPRSGSKILLERIPWFWNSLSFKKKMTVRNLFRYKGRNLMTLVGIAGCTMLIVTGFGISDTISGLATTQVGDIQSFNSMVYLNEDVSPGEANAFGETLSTTEGVSGQYPIFQTTYETDLGNGQEQSVSVVVPLGDLEAFQDYVHLRDRENPDEHLDLTESGPMINERLAEHYEAEVGDTITIVDDENQEFSIDVNQIYENYVEHYIYMTPDQYTTIFGEEPSLNTYYLLYGDSVDAKALEETIAEQDSVLSVVNLDMIAETASNATGSLEMITVVLILAAAGLAFVVLYNLTNINIGERIGELSTIKVLGFYDLEVSLYIYDEIFIISIFGGLLGLGLGTIMTQWIMKTMQMANLLFHPVITLPSYIYSFLISIAFTMVVMVIMHFKLKNIDVVEALKVAD